MPLSQVTNLLLLLSAACGGAVALIVAGIALRTGAPGPGDAASGARGPLQPALQKVHPITQVALELVFLALLAAIPNQPLREIAMLAVVAFFAVDALQASSGAFGIKQLVRSRTWLLIAVQAGGLVMASLWGDRLAPGDGVGRIYPFAVAAVMVLATTFLGMLPARFGPAGPLGAAAIGSVAAWALSTQVLGASDLWQPAAAGCALAAAVTVVLAIGMPGEEEPPAPLALAVTLCAGAAMMLIGREYGMYGVGLAAVALLPLALVNLRLASLLSALFAGRAMLQWVLVAVTAGVAGPGKGAIGLDITQPYALAALVAGLVLATAPSLFSPYLKSQASQLATILALAALPPLAGAIVGASALPALLVGLLAAGVALPPATHRLVPVLLVYTGAVSALVAPRLADLSPLPTLWRLVALGVAVAVVTLAAVLAARSAPSGPAT